MKIDIIERYERTGSGKIIVDISAQKVEDLYDDFDRRSQFLKKDLNKDLVEYMIESVMEIEQEEFLIQFSLEKRPEDESISRVKNSVNNFFIYMAELESRKMKEMGRSSLILLFIGLFIATISVLVSQSELIKISVVTAVIAEGLTVAAWVSLWEALATFLIKWMPYKRKVALFERISNAEVRFNFIEKTASQI